MNLNGNKIIEITTTVINTIFCIILPFSILTAMFSPMLFDAPGSEESFYTTVLFLSLFTSPIVILISVTTSRKLLFSLKEYKIALVFSLLPLINVIAFLFALWGIETFQNGRFTI